MTFSCQNAAVAMLCAMLPALTEVVEKEYGRVYCLFVILINFFPGVNFDSSVQMVAHLKRQSHHLRWTAEKKKCRIPQERHEQESQFM